MLKVGGKSRLSDLQSATHLIISVVFHLFRFPWLTFQAVEVLKAERVGHGYGTLGDPDLYRELLAQDIHFEVTPSPLLSAKL